MQISAFFRRFLHDPLDNGSFVGYICLVPAVCVSSSARFFRTRRWQCTAAHSPRRHFSQPTSAVLFPRTDFSRFRFPDPVFPAVRPIFRSFHLCKDASGSMVRRHSISRLLRLDAKPRFFMPGFRLRHRMLFPKSPGIPLRVSGGLFVCMFRLEPGLNASTCGGTSPACIKKRELIVSSLCCRTEDRGYSTAAHSLTNSSAMHVSISSVFFSPLRIVSIIFLTFFSGR